MICKLAEGALCPSARPLLFDMFVICPGLDLQGDPLGTGLQLDFMLLIAALGAWQFSQFSVHLTVHLSSPYFISLSLRVLRETARLSTLKLR